ncbi:hypothetical protein [Rouxiella sp. Mn2063]|uniref:hypothetical protein n=1 Tax=Rouxiella sp. Mn2063 TaxID=3395262 RepID=UPI003BCB6C05
MNKFDIETQKEISILVGFLSSVDEGVVSDEDYLLIKNKNVNNENDLRYISGVIFKPWFLEYTSTNKDKVIQSIEFIINGKSDVIDAVISEVNFIFDYEIEDKPLFLMRIKRVLEGYMGCDTSGE